MKWRRKIGGVLNGTLCRWYARIAENGKQRRPLLGVLAPSKTYFAVSSSRILIWLTSRGRLPCRIRHGVNYLWRHPYTHASSSSVQGNPQTPFRNAVSEVHSGEGQTLHFFRKSNWYMTRPCYGLLWVPIHTSKVWFVPESAARARRPDNVRFSSHQKVCTGLSG